MLSKAVSVEPLLVDASDAAKLCGVSRSCWYGWLASGQAPGPALRKGRVTRWSRLELVRWVEAGCPPRDRWAEIGGRRHG